jgi:uncharacterized protein (TIGR03437 family)
MIVSAGGLANSGVTTDNESYTMGSNSWTTLAAMPTARNAGCFQALGSTLYVAGGNEVGNTTQLTTMDAYDATTNSWTTGLPTMPHGVVGAGSATVNGRLYCFGGSNEGNPLVGTVFNYVQIYQPALAPPSITSGGVVPIYSTATTIQPGEFVSIYGTNLGPSSPAIWTGNFPTSLGGASVTIDGKAAYLLLVDSTQINLQAPDDPATGTVSVVVTTPNGTAASTVTLGEFGPSFSLLDGKHVAGIILRSDGSGAYGGGIYDIVGPTGTSLGYPTVAAKAGDTLELFGVGFGPTNPVVPAGQVYSGAAATTNSVQLLINNVTVLPAFSGITSAGLYQLNVVQLPAGLGTGDLPLLATVGGVQTQTGVVISLQ